MNKLPALTSALCLVCAVSGAGRAAAQMAPIAQQSLAYSYDSGFVSNPSAREQVVASQTVHVQPAGWIRLRFALVALAHADDQDPADGAFLRITSHYDGAVQELHTRHAREWRNTSAYFNGGTLQLELVAPPHAGPSRVALRSVWIGPLLGGPLYAQCGATDDRVLASDAGGARLLPTNCSGFLIDDCAHCFATAGHCDNPYLQVAEFNVPPSLALNVLQHPSPDDQYSVDGSSVQSENGGVGNDWAHFGVFANSNTGLTPFEAQSVCYTLAAAPPAFDPAKVLRVTGYGVDYDDPTHWQVQQTNDGPFYSYSTTVLRYVVDTFGGDSGAPVTWDAGGGEVIGIHTHGGCNSSPPIGANWGTAIDQPNFRAALGSPQGVCLPTASWVNYCTTKVNSQGCSPTLSALGLPSASAGAGSFTILAGSLINLQSALLLYGTTQRGLPWKGGFLCVGAPLVRLPVVDSGGSPGGTDCTGSLASDMGARIASGVDAQLACGATIYAQVWSRDPPDLHHVNTTAGLRFTIGP